ncbi:MAG: AraC family transcriptional regulator [Eubacteriales bacterium]|nr:AraC family transcriptional regulator [Eubacteriales bacterium]
MAPSLCNCTTDSHGRELAEHGTPQFPFASYDHALTEEIVPWHWHDELEAVLISEGQTAITIGSQKYIVSEGDGFFVNSGVLHDCVNYGTVPCRFHSLVFHPRLIGGNTGSIFWKKYVQPIVDDPSFEGLYLDAGIPWHQRILEDIGSAWQASVNEANGYEFEIRNALSDILFIISRQRPSFSPSASEKTLRDNRRIKQMLTFIQEHFSEEILVRDIADNVSLSESECLRCFKKTIGTTPIQYLKKYRIQQAADLLTATPLKITEIATGCGFLDMSYFAKSFKESKGCTPSQFRKISGSRKEVEK